MKKQQLLAAIGAAIISLGMVNSADAILISRLGGKAYYDDVADLTWLADANAAKTSGYDADGAMNWIDANVWAAGLNIAGVTGWRLPDTIDVGNDGATATNIYQGVDFGFNITTHSELSNMYYNVLGNTAYYDTSGVETGCGTAPNYCLMNTGPFSNIQPRLYWSATEYASNTFYAWVFYMTLGYQVSDDKTLFDFYAWPVQSGDVSTVPEPPIVLLLATGLLGLIWLKSMKSV